jgi:hypothetical protein
MISNRTFFISMLVVGTLGTGVASRNCDVAVTAEAQDHAFGQGLYFPPGAIWTQDVTHARLDPQSSKVIAWLADAGGWGTGKMHVDFAIRVLQADSSSPDVPFRKGKDEKEEPPRTPSEGFATRQILGRILRDRKQ